MRERLERAIAIALVVCAGSGAAATAAGSLPAVQTSRGCYLVGQSVSLTGKGFAPSRTYDVTVDGVDFGQSRTDSTGALSARFIPGGLGAGVVQSIDRLEVSDGSGVARAGFTVTRQTGARFEASRGNPRRLRAPFQAWGFALDGTPHPLYLHYVSPAGKPRSTVPLGRAAGQCGYLRTPPMRLFPFSASVGRWTLQVDTQPGYAARPAGPLARIVVVIARG